MAHADLEFDTNEINLRLKEAPASKPNSNEQLVVKVCDTSDTGVHNSALNESRILQKLNCPAVNKFIAFYEDQILNKSYLVLVNAGEQNLAQFVTEMRKSKFNT